MGARRAKIWLDMTTRADTRWVNPDPAAISKLTFPWARTAAEPFSFDLGGLLKGGDLEGQIFLAESKYYHVYGELAEHYRKYLAQCYCALTSAPAHCDQFMFITWHPFSVTSWADLITEKYVRESVLKYRQDALDETDKTLAEGLVSDSLCKQIADRLWIIVLSDRQEQELIMSAQDLALIRKHRTEMEYSDA